jgi:hypothetical protein
LLCSWGTYQYCSNPLFNPLYRLCRCCITDTQGRGNTRRARYVLLKQNKDMPVTLTQLCLQLLEQDGSVDDALCGTINAGPQLQLASSSNQNLLGSIASEPLPDLAMQGGRRVAIRRPDVIETGTHCFANVFCPSRNYSFVQMGIFPPDPTVRGLHWEPDGRRESLTSLVHEMQKCLAHRPHFQTPKKLPGCVKKSHLIAA